MYQMSSTFLQKIGSLETDETILELQKEASKISRKKKYRENLREVEVKIESRIKDILETNDVGIHNPSGLILVGRREEKSGKIYYGFINQDTLKVEIPIKYEGSTNFKKGIAIVKTSSKNIWEVIDTKGEKVQKLIDYFGNEIDILEHENFSVLREILESYFDTFPDF